MKLLQLFCLLLIMTLLSCEETITDPPDPPAQDILTKLQNIPGATVEEMTATAHFNRLFKVSVTQLVDHTNPGGPTFQQKIFVGHVGEDLPVVFETEGYSRENFKIRELSPAMQCNQISVEHRYNGSSKPTPTDWQYLTIKQAADDLHKIVQQFKPIYPESWVSSGRSKGGETAIFHRRFYPDDVDATVAYVAPILFSSRDETINAYLNTVGDEDCRNQIKAFQRRVLTKKDSIASLIPGFVTWVNDNFDTDFSFLIPHEMVVKYIAIDYPFEFWSSTSQNCTTIPDSTANAQELFDHIIEVVDILLFYSDYGVDFWQGWYYQAETEIGNFVYQTDHLDDLLGEVLTLNNFYDFGGDLQFDPSAMQDIDQWVQTEGDNIIFIYGEEDPWTVAQFEIGNLDVLKIINPITKHETAICDLNLTNQMLIKEKLSSWLNYQEISFCDP